MPIIKRAAKKLRHDRKRTKQTMHVRSVVRDAIKKARNKPSVASITHVFHILDKAAKRHIIHKNKASRLKSRLSLLLKKK